MKLFTQLVCPVSSERVDENRVRVNALGVVLIMGGFFITGMYVFPAFLVLDFFIRAFTKLAYSPLGYLAHIFVKVIGTQPVIIDKAPKVFAARIGFVFALITSLGALLGLPLLAFISGSVLVLFAFLECGLNFCMGCWLYTFVVYPMVRKNGD
ncbi:MAG: DUF4395 domain-containing protein [Bacteroidales bacterium]|nr:DUF4395 domain-containing protein [Bacteroidales bacterium]